MVRRSLPVKEMFLKHHVNFVSYISFQIRFHQHYEQWTGWSWGGISSTSSLCHRCIVLKCLCRVLARGPGVIRDGYYMCWLGPCAPTVRASTWTVKMTGSMLGWMLGRDTGWWRRPAFRCVLEPLFVLILWMPSFWPILRRLSRPVTNGCLENLKILGL